MIYTGSSDDLKRLIDGKKDEIAQAVRTAREGMDKIIAFCYPASTTDMRELPNDPIKRNEILGRDYLFDLLEAYIEGGGSERRMEQFAENYQRRYPEVKALLDFLGLEVESTVRQV